VRNQVNRIFKTAHSPPFSKRTEDSLIERTSPRNINPSNMPTENLKFQQFLDIIFNSKLSNREIKQETRDYVMILETNYTDKIREL